MVISHSDNIVLMWLSRQPELHEKKGVCVGGWDESARILRKCSGMRWVYLHVLRCVCVCLSVSGLTFPSLTFLSAIFPRYVTKP